MLHNFRFKTYIQIILKDLKLRCFQCQEAGINDKKALANGKNKEILELERGVQESERARISSKLEKTKQQDWYLS